MVSGSISVLGVDGADYRLLQEWECENLLLDNHQSLKTEAYTLEHPSTFEVWPSIATGVTPDEHGVWLEAKDRDNSDSFVQKLTSINSYFPSPLKERTINIKRKLIGNELPTTDHHHLFEEGAVYNWPGITPCVDFYEQNQAFSGVVNGNTPPDKFRKDQIRYSGQALGWLLGSNHVGTPIAGIHIHPLDYFGHLYGDNPKQLRNVYESVDELVGLFRQHFDQFVVISDHGMETNLLCEDNPPGEHSFRATISTNIKGDLPDSILDVRSWLEPKITQTDTVGHMDSTNAPTEHLEDLGYL